MLRYVKGTTNFGLTYKMDKIFYLKGYSDNDYGRDFVEAKNTLYVIFYLRENIVT